MPQYPAAVPISLSSGNQLALVNNAAIDTGVTTTTQFAVGPSGTSTGVTLMIMNSTNQTAQGQYAPSDVAAEYQNLSGCIVPAGAALAYNLANGWMRFTFSSAPTSGSLIVSR